MVNWPKVWFGARRGGVNGYMQGLALRLVEAGHEVITLSSGTTDAPDGAPPRVIEHKPWRNIRAMEIVGSPVLAPGKRQFDDPSGEVASPALEQCCQKIARDITPDIVHIQSLEGLSASCVPALASTGARTVFSLHNYHTVCPQVYLMQGKRIPCRDFDAGKACAGCATRYDHPLPGADPRGREHPDPVGWPAEPVLLRLARAPLTNDRAPEPLPDDQSNPYAARRASMIAMLNACDRVLAVSPFVADLYAGMGVDPARLLHMPIGVEIADRVASMPPAMFDPPADPARPLRAVFLGFHNVFKGLPILLDALDGLDPGALGRLHLCVHAAGAEAVLHRLRRLEPRLARLSVSPGYEPEDIPHLLAGADLGIVPSVWWDNGPQTVLEMLACRVPVLGSAVGGIPGFIEDGVNGWLVPGADAPALGDAIRERILRPDSCRAARERITPPTGMRKHAQEMLALYASLAHEAVA